MRAEMRRNPHALAEGLGAWLAGGKSDLELEAAETAAITVSEIMLLVAGYVTQGKFGGG